MEVSSDRLFCCSWLRRRVPLAHREELYHILRMTGPLSNGDSFVNSHEFRFIYSPYFIILNTQFPLGIQAAACARVGNALGAGDSARALLTSKVSLCLAAAFALVEGVVLGCSKTVIGFIFTSDERKLTDGVCYTFSQSAGGYTSVSTGCQDGTTASQGDHEVQQLKDTHLSTTQLVIRRGLTMFAAVALLAVGAAVHFLVPLPEVQFAEVNHTATDWINATYTPDTNFSTMLVPNEELE
ncbi:hypothetical protein GOODEAATRI_015358 [Goodea atripinnis]|uniref:Uncharacterized protein n=1 Tax=Goodea atripinnis TaxID=208336 RepID=A0ABV0NKH7_9TELE